MGKSKGKTILGIVGFGLGVWLGGVGFGLKSSQWLLGGLYGASIGTSLWTMTQKPKNGSSSITYNFDQLMNQVGSDNRIPIIYGRRKWGGQQTYHKTSSNNQSMVKDIVWCEGEIGGISDLRANDLEIASLSGCSYTRIYGSPLQLPPDNYTTVGGYRNVAWSRFNLKASDKLTGGNPTVTAIIEGKKVYDTRTKTTAYSNNPAMCVRDYLLSKRYGAGHFITADMLDEDSFAEVADYCDELVTARVPTTLATADAINNKITELERYLAYHPTLSTKARKEINDEIISLRQSLIDIQSNPVEYTIDVSPRYSLNIILAETKSHIEILQDMFAVFGGFLVFTNNKVALRCEKETPIAYAFTDDTIIADTLDHTQYPIDQSPNQYSIKFYDPNNEWAGVKVLVEDAVDQQERGKIISKEVDLIGCTNQAQALRLARLYRDKIKLCSIVIQFQTATMAMHLEPGDVITVSKKLYPNGQEQWLFQDMPFRILEISEQKGTYSIKAEQYNASIYNDALGAQIQDNNYVQIPNALSSDIPNVINVDVQEYFENLGNGQWINEAKVTWNADDIFYKHAEVYMLSDNPAISDIDVSLQDLGGTIESLDNSSNSWNLIGTGNDSLAVSNLVKGLTYTFKIVAVNTKDRKADFNNAPTVNFYCRGKTLTPSTPKGLTVSITDVCAWNWSMGDTDLDFWELRTDKNVGETVGLLTSTAVNKAIVTPPSRQGTVYLFAHNTGGYYSDPCVLTYNHPAPAAPQAVDITQVFQGFVVTTETLPAFGQGINVHIDDGEGGKVFFSSNNSYTYKTLSGIYDVQAAFVDLFGEGVLSKGQQIIVEPEIDAKWLKNESISLEKMDEHVAAMLVKAQDAVSGVVFNETVNQLTQADTAIAAQITQTAESVTSIVTELNKSPGSSSYSSISQLLSAINLRVISTDFSAAMQPLLAVPQPAA